MPAFIAANGPGRLRASSSGLSRSSQSFSVTKAVPALVLLLPDSRSKPETANTFWTAGCFSRFAAASSMAAVVLLSDAAGGRIATPNRTP